MDCAAVKGELRTPKSISGNVIHYFQTIRGFSIDYSLGFRLQMQSQECLAYFATQTTRADCYQAMAEGWLHINFKAHFNW